MTVNNNLYGNFVKKRIIFVWSCFKTYDFYFDDREFVLFKDYVANGEMFFLSLNYIKK